MYYDGVVEGLLPPDFCLKNKSLTCEHSSAKHISELTCFQITRRAVLPTMEGLQVTNKHRASHALTLMCGPVPHYKNKAQRGSDYSAHTHTHTHTATSLSVRDAINLMCLYITMFTAYAQNADIFKETLH